MTAKAGCSLFSDEPSRPSGASRRIHNTDSGGRATHPRRAIAVSKTNRKSNRALVALIDDLRDQSRSTGSALWRDIARRLDLSRKNWAEPNLSRLSRHAADKDTILVPGKVLGSGEISGGQTVAAYSFSSGARTKIEASGGRTLSIRELMEENPNGRGVRILG